VLQLNKKYFALSTGLRLGRGGRAPSGLANSSALSRARHVRSHTSDHAGQQNQALAGGRVTKLGQLRRVDPRSVWRHVARDFAPWLRSHLGLLAEVVGLQLDLVETGSVTEKQTIDVRARELQGGRWVVIENQLDQTDHRHMGQLVSDAAGQQAGVSIWISPQFRDEHRRALEWLNEISDESTLFFGVELELFQIGDSPPAPNFKLVAKPAGWDSRADSSIPSRWQRAYREFFRQLGNRLRSKLRDLTTARSERRAFFNGLVDKADVRYPKLNNTRRGYLINQFSYSVGRNGFSVTTAFSQDRKFRVELYIDTGDPYENLLAFDTLYRDREEIESGIGHPLVWQRMDAWQASRIYCATNGKIGDTPEHLGELQEWAVDLIWRFTQVFEPRVEELKL
jgi:hypothetical protein